MNKKINIVIEQETLPNAVSEMVSHKEALKKYRSGKMSKEEFSTYGIRFSTPL